VIRGGVPTTLVARTTPLGRSALPKRFHQTSHLGRGSLLWFRDFFASLLLLDQFAERALVVILEFLRLELPGFGRNDAWQAPASALAPSRPPDRRNSPALCVFRRDSEALHPIVLYRAVQSR
jgi:hypothetical protein